LLHLQIHLFVCHTGYENHKNLAGEVEPIKFCNESIPLPGNLSDLSPPSVAFLAINSTACFSVPSDATSLVQAQNLPKEISFDRGGSISGKEINAKPAAKHVNRYRKVTAF